MVCAYSPSWREWLVDFCSGIQRLGESSRGFYAIVSHSSAAFRVSSPGVLGVLGSWPRENKRFTLDVDKLVISTQEAGGQRLGKAVEAPLPVAAFLGFLRRISGQSWTRRWEGCSASRRAYRGGIGWGPADRGMGGLPRKSVFVAVVPPRLTNRTRLTTQGKA